ncbi:hypothetical protein ACIBEA_44060 [Streptomyces sp. NPDC051555]|uniref:hypothetical protein n=1 Tax=Streptomyces sp. NPDC051555 TaxID=3365657 RepID=UPI0037A214E1
MIDSSLLGSAHRLPHYCYAEAVALVDGPGGPYEPDEWTVDIADTGILFATFYYRRTTARTSDHRHGSVPSVLSVDPVVNDKAWPHGVALSWDSADGWAYTPLRDEFSTTEDYWDPLPVDRLAAPAALRAVLVPLLDGREDDMPASPDRWEEPRAATLSEYLDHLPTR